MANNNFNIILRLALTERSGLSVSGLDGEFHVNDTVASVIGMNLKLPTATSLSAICQLAIPPSVR